MQKQEKKDESMKIDFDGGFTLLTVIFACLKLAGVIDWSWWIVFLPILVPIGLAAIVLVVVFLLLVLKEICNL